MCSQRPDDREGQLVAHGVKAAEFLTEQPGQHGDDLKDTMGYEYLMQKNLIVSPSQKPLESTMCETIEGGELTLGVEGGNALGLWK